MGKDTKMIVFIVVGLVGGFWLVTKFLDWFDSQKNATDASNSTAGEVEYGPPNVLLTPNS